MKPRLLPFTFLLSAMLGLALLTNAQESSKEAVKKTSDTTEVETPELKHVREEIARREAKQKAAVLVAVNATGPVSLPDWTPKVPQFTPSGPATRKLIDGEAKIAPSGTSPLKPGEIGNAWEAAKLDRLSHSRSDDTLNDTETRAKRPGRFRARIATGSNARTQRKNHARHHHISPSCRQSS